MFTRILLSSIFILIFFCKETNAQEYVNLNNIFTIDRSHSYIDFSVTYMGYGKVRGSFERFNGAILFVEGDLKKTSVSILINTNSIDTNHDMRDADLKSDNWFDTNKYPNITFISDSVIVNEYGFSVVGHLTIKGITRSVTLNMNPTLGISKDIRGDCQIVFTGSLDIDRTDFNVQGENWSRVKEGIVAVSDIVSIEFSILGKQINLDNQLNFVKNPNTISGAMYQIYMSKGLDQAINYFRNLDTSDQRPGVFYTIANTLIKQEEYNQAISILNYSINKYPDYPYSYLILGDAYLAISQFEKAKSNYKMAISLNPSLMYSKEILRHLE